MQNIFFKKIKYISGILVFSMLFQNFDVIALADEPAESKTQISEEFTQTVSEADIVPDPEVSDTERDPKPEIPAASTSDGDCPEETEEPPYGSLSLNTASSFSVTRAERQEIDGKCTTVRAMSGAVSTARWSSPVYSYICDNEDSTFSIVDYSSDRVHIDTYKKSNCSLSKSQTLKKELDIFGGFYSGSKYNYIVFGQANDRDDNSKEVLRVVKYDKNFNRISALSVTNCYTSLPFNTGSLRMSEYGNELVIHTSRQRYLTEDNLRHQSQLTVIVNTDNMSLKNISTPYPGNHVSHSFNQFVLHDGAKHVLLDHGDAYPRSIVLSKSEENNSYQTVSLFDIPGTVGANCTGLTLGGFEASANNYIVAASTIDHTKARGFSSQTIDIDLDERDVAIFTIPKKSNKSSAVKKILLTDYVGNKKLASTPYLVKLANDQFAVLWEEFEYVNNVLQDNGVRIIKIDENGEKASSVNTYETFRLSSDCQPVLIDKTITWYINNPSGTRYLYRINSEKFKKVQHISVSKLDEKYYGDAPFRLEVVPDKNSGLSTFEFISTNPQVATIDATGLITIRGVGKTKITVFQAGNDKYLEFTSTQTLKVRSVVVSEIALDRIQAEVNVGDSFRLAATVIPANATFPEIAWSSSSPATAFVTQDGFVSALRPGKAIIKVKALYDGTWNACSVTVKDPKIDVTKVELTPATSVMSPGETLQLSATVLPENATNKHISWSSSNESVATVSGNGVVTAREIGTATITVTTDENARTASCQIVVRQDGNFWVEPIADQTYTGKAIKPKPVIWDGSYKLVEGKDYNVIYKNNKNVPAYYGESPCVIVAGKGNYTGRQTISFNIIPKDLNDADITANDITTEYNGKYQLKKPTVSWNGKKLKMDRDYNVKYKQDPTVLDGSGISFRNVGWHEIILTGTGNYTGSRKIYEIISEKKFAMSKAKVSKTGSVRYTGSPITLSDDQLRVTMGSGSKKVKLIRDKDYTVTYLNNRDIGKATAVLTGIGRYAGVKRVTFKITGKSIKGASVSGLKATYSGTGQVPDITVYCKGIYLEKDKDYTVTVKPQKNAGKTTLTIKGINAYSGTVKKTFQVTPYNIKENAGGKITGLENAIVAKYTCKGCQPVPTLYFAGTPLVAGKDFTVSYKNNKKTSAASSKQATMTIKGKGNFKGSIKKEFTIVGKALNDAEAPVRLIMPNISYVNKPGNYRSKPILIDVNGKELTAGKDYGKVVYSLSDGSYLSSDTTLSANTTVKAKVTGKGAYSGELESTFRITETKLENAWTKVPGQTYTGKEITLKDEDIVITLSGEALVPGMDYRIVKGSYKNNIESGTASVTIEGLGNYSGVKVVTFEIESRLLRFFHF